MDNTPQYRPGNRTDETLLDREIAAALRTSIVNPPADFTDLLMAEIEPAPAIVRQSAPNYGRLPLYLIGLSFALVVIMLLLPSSQSAPANESPLFSSSLLWTCCAIGLIGMLGLTQIRRFTDILPR